MALTTVVMRLSGAGMYAFEKEAKGGLESYGEAPWWTATIATFFLECDAESAESEVASAASIAQIRTEITALRSRIAELLTQKGH